MLLKHFSQGRAATCGRASSTGSSSNGVRLVQPVRGSAAKHGGEPTNHTLLQASVGLVSERSSLVPTKAALADPVTSTSSFSSMLDDDSDYDEQQEVIQVDMAEEDPSLKVENLGLSPVTVAALQKRGIQSLFPIQKVVFAPCMEGRDLIGRAKTGSGKTLAFALPIVEGLLEEDLQSGSKPVRGRPPRAIVLAPTRELANQTANEFKTVCPSLNVVSVYGGTSISMQISDLRRGADVVVGTPGRVIDLIERGSLSLDKVRYAILDEADQMLDMGFEEDMEKILSFAPKERQTLLFSATLPKWVNKVARRFQENPLLVDLVGEENTGRLADTIRLLVMQVEHNQKMNALMDAITMHAANGKTIVFVNTKARANEVCDNVSQVHPAVALHGDISQAQRDRALQMFRDGRVPVLVATDVAARGLDIPSVDLVLHYDVPQDNEAFLHRSGRTGRANKTGTAVVLFTDKETRTLGLILKATKVEGAELIGSPEPKEVLTQATRSVLTQLDKVDTSVIDFFVPTADKLLASDQPARVLAASLAALAGFRAAPQPRSLLTYEEGFTTLRLLARPGQLDGWRSLSRALGILLKTAKINKPLENAIGKIKVVEDSKAGLAGVAFDLPGKDAAYLLSHPGLMQAVAKSGMVLDKPQSIALEVQGMIGAGGFDRSDRFGRGGGSSYSSRGSSSFGSPRGGSSRGSFSSSRGSAYDRANSYSSSRGGGGSGGGYESERGGWGSRGASTGRGDRSDRAYGGRSSGASTRGSKTPGAGSRTPSRGGSKGGSSSWSDDSSYDSNSFFDAADDGYFSGSSKGGGSWAQW
uniref:RNA helicase n=1 Tax=Dunaliella tertiolecta TaxID=3047 RepID=A0A6S8LJW3_DUNTE